LLCVIKTDIREVFADNGSVLLFDTAVVVLSVCTGTAELARRGITCEVFDEDPVYELRALDIGYGDIGYSN
jgi:hypothetical protein